MSNSYIAETEGVAQEVLKSSDSYSEETSTKQLPSSRAWMYPHGKLINGVSNVLYTVNGGANAYLGNISTEAQNWMYTGYIELLLYMVGENYEA